MSKSSLFAVIAIVGTSFAFIGSAQGAATPAIEIVNSNAGQVKTAHFKNYDGKVYVSGLVARPSSPSGASHVDVKLVDAKGQTILVKSANVAITGKPSTNRTFSYVVSFDPSVFAQAENVQVSFSHSSHTSCKE